MPILPSDLRKPSTAIMSGTGNKRRVPSPKPRRKRDTEEKHDNKKDDQWWTGGAWARDSWEQGDWGWDRQEWENWNWNKTSWDNINWRKNDRSWTDLNAAGRTTNNTTATGNQRQSARTPEIREVGLDPSKPALKRRRADPDKPKETHMTNHDLEKKQK